MNFDFSDDQKMLRDQARRFLGDHSSLKQVRAVLEDDAVPYDEALWKGMAELGWTGTTIPEEYGGAGMSYEDLCVIAEEVGRSLAPTPLSSSLYLAAEALLQAGSEAQKRAWLPRLAMGEIVGCFALAEGVGVPTQSAIKVAARDGRLSGSKVPVADGDIADIAVVLARSDAGPTLYLVELNGAGVRRAAVDTIDPTRSHARLDFDKAPAELLGKEDEGWAIAESVLDRAAILIAFEQVGGAQACLDMAAEHARNRYAFGRPIGANQAIKHKLVDIYVAIELARANAYYGAWALTANASDLPIAAAAARVAASEAFNLAAREGLQTHGAMGFTWEFDCHLFYRRAKLLSLALGGERRWKDRLIGQLEKRNIATAEVA
jgi:alkylation response protein AidB-like acyl-CoA dehydrogenase